MTLGIDAHAPGEALREVQREPYYLPVANEREVFAMLADPTFRERVAA